MKLQYFVYNNGNRPIYMEKPFSYIKLIGNDKINGYQSDLCNLGNHATRVLEVNSDALLPKDDIYMFPAKSTTYQTDEFIFDEELVEANLSQIGLTEMPNFVSGVVCFNARFLGSSGRSVFITHPFLDFSFRFKGGALLESSAGLTRYTSNIITIF